MKEYFRGYYFKHQKGNHTISFIAGISSKTSFIQVITEKSSYKFIYRKDEYNEQNKIITIKGCKFSPDEIKIDIETAEIRITGKIKYENLIPLKSNIMGIFKYFPMQCKHEIISMRHTLDGYFTINNEKIDFSGGTGYIEGDNGISFPKRYCWIQCNDFIANCSVFASVAEIPFASFHFNGCIAVVWYEGHEYRFATYNGVKILKCSKIRLILRQGDYLLDISLPGNIGYELLAPEKGNMSRIIKECVSCRARFRFWNKGILILDETSNHASYEFTS